MKTLGIFTVKRLAYHKGRYYTYGGFGDYLAGIRPYFDNVILVAHVKSMLPPGGYYVIPSGHLEVVHLPQVKSELGNFLIMPIMFWKSFMAARKMSIAHVRMPDYTGIIGAVVCSLRGIPYFCQIIADWHIEAQKTPVTKKYGLGLFLKLDYYLYDYLERWICRRQLVFAQGQSCYDKHAKRADATLVLSSAHRMEDLADPRETFQKKPLVILTVARLTGIKNHELIIRALACLNRDEADWRVVFVGEGPRKDALQVLAKEMNVEKWLTFEGQMSRGKELWKYYDVADVFVLPSRSEGTPKVLLEAMARCVPVVASNVGGIPTSVMHGVRGLLFKDNDINELCDCLLKVASDHELRRKMVSCARSFASEHTIENETERMLDMVNKKWPHLTSEQ